MIELVASLGGMTIGVLLCGFFKNQQIKEVKEQNKRDCRNIQEAHSYLMEEKDFRIESIQRECDVFKEKVEFLVDKTQTLNTKIAVAESLLQEMDKEKEMIYLEKIEEKIKGHSLDVLAKYLLPLQEKVMVLSDSINKNKEEQNAFIDKEIQKVYLSNTELHKEVVKQVEDSANNIKDSIRTARPPQHIICGSLP